MRSDLNNLFCILTKKLMRVSHVKPGTCKYFF